MSWTPGEIAARLNQPERADAPRGEEWLTDSSWAQLGLTVKGEMGASGLPT